MKAFATWAVLLFCTFATARDQRLSDECLRGIRDRNECCNGVPDAWYAHLRNPIDCASFYQCEHGQATWKACPKGTHWSVDDDQCEWPNKANCTVDSTSPPPSTTPPPSTNTPPPPPECGPAPVCHQCLNGVFPADLCCRDVQTYHKLRLADASDCSNSFQCANGKAIRRPCPAGLHWSVKSDQCEWPSVAQCNANDNGNGNGNGDNNGGNGGNNGGNGGNNGGDNNGNGNSNVSQDCLNGNASATECCRNVPTWVDVLLQNNADCHTYIQCVHGSPMVRPCPANLWWSITANRCEWLENATCTW